MRKKETRGKAEMRRREGDEKAEHIREGGGGGGGQ